MESQLKKAKKILSKYKQEHLLQFYNELSEEQKSYLLNQILRIDFDEILYLYEKSKSDIFVSTEEIEPLPYINRDNLSLAQLNNYLNLGTDALLQESVGVITLAGGQGSRLGFKGPKGTFLLDLKPKISLFEIVCNYLKEANEKYNITIPWYIMTSMENNALTIKFFEEHNYFNYPKDCILFFTQENLPLINTEGKLILDDLYKIKEASNGNGDLFHALQKHDLIQDMENRNLQWLFVGGVDNVLLNPIDPLFIGATIYEHNEIASKTLFKKEPNDFSWVFARRDNKPAIVDCENFVSELSRITNENGDYLYREVNMLAHLFNISAIKKLANIHLDYHRAFRKSAFINYEGVKQVPSAPNIYKFEKFVFDAFSFFDNITLLRVDVEKEFAPIKDFNGPYNPEVAKKMYKKQILHIENSLEEDED